MPRTCRNHRNGPRRTLERNGARYQTTSLPAFDFGEVIDLSASGMRIRRRSRPVTVVGAIEKFAIIAGPTPLVLRGRVVWVRRRGLLARGHELGVQFLCVDKALSDRLVHLGRFGFDPGDAPRQGGARADRRILTSIEVEDLYSLLCVPENADPRTIATAYRRLVHRWHPDVCREDGAQEHMARISKAYKVLRDRELRRQYDELRAIAVVQMKPKGRRSPSTASR
jgi:hypothetical protein